MKKILIISNALPSEDKPYAGVFVLNQYVELKKNNDFSIDISGLQRKKTNRVGSILKYFMFFLRLVPLLFRKYSVVHIHFFYPLIYWVWLYKAFHPKTKIFVTCHGTDVKQGVSNTFKKALSRYTVSCVDVLISVGNELAYKIRSELGFKKVVVLPAGINQEIFKPIDSVKIYDLIFVGSQLDGKGIHELVDALSLLGRRISIAVVGNGPLISEWERISRFHNIKQFNSLSQPEIAELYSKSRFLVLPSKSEAFGLVISEAMYCGTPVIASNVGGIKDQVVNGCNGFFIDDISVYGILNTIELALDLSDDEYKLMCESAKVSNKNFSLAEVCRVISKMYKE